MTLWIGTSWKMNKLRADAAAFCETLRASPAASGVPGASLFVIPPFTVLRQVAEALEGTAVTVGAQNAHWEDSGPWTGEVSVPQARDCGARLVEIGHSERRTFFNETDETVARKAEAAVRHGLTALVCIGDTREEYEAGRTAEALRRQTEAALSRIDWSRGAEVMLAYEPVWSIGEGGTPADPSFADGQHARVKEIARARTGRDLKVLYGGSVNPSNCADLAARPHVDGLFVGRAAWAAEGFLDIVARVSERTA